MPTISNYYFKVQFDVQIVLVDMEYDDTDDDNDDEVDEYLRIFYDFPLLFLLIMKITELMMKMYSLLFFKIYRASRPA